MKELVLPTVLDACCGSRMFWFDRRDTRAVFVDKRSERHTHWVAFIKQNHKVSGPEAAAKGTP